jgi:uroporphyrin-3 C-methyltransferase
MSSDKTTSHDSADEETVEAELDPQEGNVTDETAEDFERDPDPEAIRQVGKKKGAGVVTWLALLLSIVAIAAVALDYLRDQETAGESAQSDAELQTLTASVNATQNALSSLEQSVSALSELDAERGAALDRFGRQLNDRLRQLDSLPGRLATIEASMSSLQGISTGARDAWLLAEAEYYMQIANAQLQLARNPELAALALKHADERVSQLGDPRLMNIRQTLSDERRALEAMDTPDTAGITLTLASLAATVESLPLKQETAAREGETTGTGVNPELTGMDRAMASLRNAVDGIVSVRRADETMQPMIAPEAEYFLRANLALQLQAARLALLRGEEVVFRRSLDDVDDWLGKYYDQESTAVQSARVTIAEIRDSVLVIAMPDISGSLRLLRQFNTLADAAAPAATARPEDADEDDEAAEIPEPEQDQ